jgi:hypothetical protein
MNKDQVHPSFETAKGGSIVTSRNHQRGCSLPCLVYTQGSLCTVTWGSEGESAQQLLPGDPAFPGVQAEAKWLEG